MRIARDWENNFPTLPVRNEKVILPEVSIGNMVFPDPQKDVDLLAVPISILYDRGLLLQKTTLLDQRISAPFIIMNTKTSNERSFIAGETLKVHDRWRGLPGGIKSG